MAVALREVVGPAMVWAALLLSLSSGALLSGADAEEIGSPLRVAQCRAGCLQRFSSGPNRESFCLQGPDCFMCWENCELLQSNFPVWGAMCSEKGICFPGCQQACRFHRDTASRQLLQSQPVIHTRGEEVVQSSGQEARWPRPPTTDPTRPLVYVVMRRQAGTAIWKQVAQTVDLSTRLPTESNEVNPGTIRVLVVDPEGLVTIYSPMSSTSIQSMLGGPEVIMKPLNKMVGPHRKKINTEVTPPTTRTPVTKGGRAWQLREISLIHQKVLVIAEVAWEPRVSRGVYLVTWEVDGGGLKGNLFTDSTCVTLSLWPDTVYHIQVELVSRAPGRKSDSSETLRLDTHRAPLPTVGTPQNSIPSSVVNSPLLSVLVQRGVTAELDKGHQQRQQMEVLAGTGAAVLLFLVVMGAILWRCRQAGRLGDGSSIRRQKLVEDLTNTPGIQPVVTVSSGPRWNPSALSNALLVDGGITNPLLQQNAWSPNEDDFSSASSFLKAAEKGARNEVQV